MPHSKAMGRFLNAGSSDGKHHGKKHWLFCFGGLKNSSMPRSGVGMLRRLVAPLHSFGIAYVNLLLNIIEL